MFQTVTAWASIAMPCLAVVAGILVASLDYLRPGRPVRRPPGASKQRRAVLGLKVTGALLLVGLILGIVGLWPPRSVGLAMVGVALNYALLAALTRLVIKIRRG
jgi:hypothetical protein